MRAAAGFAMVGGGLLIMWSVLMGWRMPWEPAKGTPTSEPTAAQNGFEGVTAGGEPTAPNSMPFGHTQPAGTGYGGSERLSAITAAFALGV